MEKLLKMKVKLFLRCKFACFLGLYSCSLLARIITGPVIEDMAKIDGGQPPLCLIQVYNPDNKAFIDLCSATLIDKKHIITAAHCIRQMVVGQTKIFCGYDFVDKKFKEIFELKSAYKSEKYLGTDSSAGAYVGFDFGVAELSGDSTLSPMKILDNLEYLKGVIKEEQRHRYVIKEKKLSLLQDDVKCYIAGYGFENNGITGRLNVAELSTWAHNAVLDYDSREWKMFGEWIPQRKGIFRKPDKPESFSLVSILNQKELIPIPVSEPTPTA